MKKYNYVKFFLLTIIPIFVLFCILTILLGWHLTSICSFITFYFLIYVVGINLFYHRYWCHKQFKPNLLVCKICTLLGSLGMIPGPVMYILIHRTHHKYIDKSGDPHSPTRGIWHALLGWTFSKNHLALNNFLIKDMFQEKNKWTWTLEKYQIEIIWAVIFLTLVISPYITLGLVAAMITTYLIEISVNAFMHDSKIGGAKDAPWIFSFLTGGALSHYHHHHVLDTTTISPGDPGYWLVNIFNTNEKK